MQSISISASRSAFSTWRSGRRIRRPPCFALASASWPSPPANFDAGPDQAAHAHCGDRLIDRARDLDVGAHGAHRQAERRLLRGELAAGTFELEKQGAKTRVRTVELFPIALPKKF